MSWATLNLWDFEQKLIQECITSALYELIKSKEVLVTDDELVISGKLRPYLINAQKKLKLRWTLHPEASCFFEVDDPKPCGHPDIRFSLMTLDHEQYNYDIECKLVRIKRKNKTWDYCQHYVTDGIRRFQEGRYAQSLPAMATMIGYVQECREISDLLDEVNINIRKHGLHAIQKISDLIEEDISHLIQEVQRKGDQLLLHHKWADLR